MLALLDEGVGGDLSEKLREADEAALALRQTKSEEHVRSFDGLEHAKEAARQRYMRWAASRERARGAVLIRGEQATAEAEAGPAGGERAR